MNPKTIGIFAGAAALCGVALFLVVGAPSAPPNPPPPPDGLTPNADVTFGERVRAHAQLSQSHVLSGTSTEMFLNVDLTAEGEVAARQPVAAALLIDRSGSMKGDKLDNARDAAQSFLARLREDDQVAIVTYGSTVTTNLELSRVGDVRAQAMRIIAAINPRGGTNISGGLRTTIGQLAGANVPRRVVLISDGRPTEGERGVHQLANIAAGGRGQGMSFSTIGVGLDYDENVMEGIALKGGGGYYHLRHATALAQILAREFESIESLIASNVRLRLDPGPRIRISEVFGYDLERHGNAVVINVGDMSKDDKLRLVARALVNASDLGVARFSGLSLSYQVPALGTGESAQGDLTYAATDQTVAVSSSQKAEIIAAGYRVEANAALRESMESMSKRDRGAAVARLKTAKKRLRKAAKAAPAAAAPVLMEQAVEFDAIEAEAAGTAFDSEAGKDFVKSSRAASFAGQRR